MMNPTTKNLLGRSVVSPLWAGYTFLDDVAEYHPRADLQSSKPMKLLFAAALGLSSSFLTSQALDVHQYLRTEHFVVDQTRVTQQKSADYSETTNNILSAISPLLGVAHYASSEVNVTTTIKGIGTDRFTCTTDGENWEFSQSGIEDICQQTYNSIKY